MSAVRLTEVNEAIKNISSKYFSKILFEKKEMSGLFAEMTKSIGFYLYQTFGDENEIRNNSEIKEHTDVLVEWFSKGISSQDNALRKAIGDEEEYQIHLKRTEEDEDYLKDFITARIDHLSDHFAKNLTEYVVSKYTDKISNEDALVYAPNENMISEYRKDGDKEKLRKALIADFNNFRKKTGNKIPKEMCKHLVRKIYKDIKSLKEE